MNKLTTAIALMGVLLAPVAFSDDTDMDHSNAKAFVKDSVITTKIKASLAAAWCGFRARLEPKRPSTKPSRSRATRKA
jgi:hypothetical protein